LKVVVSEEKNKGVFSALRQINKSTKKKEMRISSTYTSIQT